MTESFLKQCGGFNPAPDFLIQKYGFEAAHTWGAVWRYCQMSEKDRPRSHEAMAERAGMSRRTFIKYLNLLIQDGYIEDLDQGVRNRPHLYDTKKGEELITSGMQNLHTEITTEPERYANSAQDNGIGVQILHTRYAEIAQPGMQNLHLIDRESLDTLKESVSTNGREPSSSYGILSRSLAKICLINLDTISQRQSRKFIDAARTLEKVKATPEQVIGFGEWWKSNWRYKNGSPPLLDQVCDLWGEFQAGYQPKKVSISAK